MKSLREVLTPEPPQPTEAKALPVPAQQRKTAREVVAAAGLATETDDLSYLMREFVQCSFPYKSPGQVEQWTKQVNGLSLTIRRGREDFGIPYGTLARLGVIWLCTQIVEHPVQDRYILGRSLAEMLRAVGFNASTARGSAKRKNYVVALRDLFACNISFSSKSGGSGLKADIGKAWDLWGDSDSIDQGSLFESWVIPQEDFRAHVLRSHVPVPVWAISNHVKSPMELDALFMISHRVHMINNRAQLGGALFITTDALKTQFGQDYGRHRDFRHKFVRALDNIQARTWPELRYTFTEEGLTLYASPQLVKSRQVDKDPSLRRHRKALKPAKQEAIRQILETRQFDAQTRDKAEMLLKGLSFSQAAQAFWGWVDERKIEVHDPRPLFFQFCISHRKRNRA